MKLFWHRILPNPYTPESALLYVIGIMYNCPAPAAAAPPAPAPSVRAAAARGVAREPLVVQRLRQQERVVVAAQGRQRRGQRGGVEAAAVPRAARAAARAGRRLGGRPLRVGPRVAHAHAQHAGAAPPGPGGGARAGHEGGVPAVPQAPGAAPPLARRRAAPGPARRERVLTPPTYAYYNTYSCTIH